MPGKGIISLVLEYYFVSKMWSLQLEPESARKLYLGFQNSSNKYPLFFNHTAPPPKKKNHAQASSLLSYPATLKNAELARARLILIQGC